jgi:hypothetical protein
MKKVYRDFEYMDQESVKAFQALTVRQQYENFSKPMAACGISKVEILSDFSMLLVCMGMEKKARDGMCRHFFFKGEHFYKWLKQCKTPLPDEQYSIFDSDKDRNEMPFMIHFEGSKNPVYLCEWHRRYDPATKEVCRKKSLVVNAGRKKHMYYYSLEGSEDGHGANDEDTKEIGGIIASALAYIQAFPEMVADGIPEDLKHPSHYRKGICRSVGIAPRLIIRDGPCPHYRNGHFRFLKSERYITKRGQVVFVHGCFVKGKAETVLGPDETPPM